MKKLAFISFSLFASIFLFFSCTKIHNIEINDIGTYPQALFDPLPIKVSVYYGNDFSTFETSQTIQHKEEVGATIIDNIKMGKANIALFDYILSSVFEKVTPVQYLSEGFDHIKDIDLIIEPTVHSFTYPKFTADGSHIHIIYAIKFYLPTGEEISSWRIKGSGLMPLEIKSETSRAKELTQMAMRQVAAKFITDFCNQEDIKQLFYKQCKQ
jgi:hypothetical protein